MAFVDAYPSGLDTEGNPEDLARADTAIYRYVTTRLAVAGLPDEVAVGEATIYLTTGPVRTQQTKRRQRPGIPFVFDKHMRRGVLVGENELLTVCQLGRAPDVDFGRAVAEWRDIAAMEAVSERPALGEQGPRFERVADRLAVWDKLRADHGEQAVKRAQQRLSVWRNLAVHRSHAFRAHWGFRRGEMLRGQGRDQAADELNPAVARRDLQIAYAAAHSVVAAVFRIAHDCGFDDARIEPLFCT